MALIAELKRRKILQVAVVYGVATWLLVQISATIEEPLSLPGWTDTLVIVLLAIGFPMTLIISWMFNVTREGLVPDSEHATVNPASKGMEYALIGLLAVAVLWLIYRDINRNEAVPAESQAVTANENLQQENNPAPLPNSVAVLPFANFSPDPDNAFFAAGIHDTILHELSKIDDMNVISRTTMMRYADSEMNITDIARELRVETVMEGSVQYAEGRVLVTAQLIDPDTDAHLWSGNYDREFADIFAIQADIATRIAGALQAELTPQDARRLEKQMTSSAQAYALYLSFMERIDWDFGPFDATAEILDLLDRAILLDPGFSQAYAAKAFVWSFHNPYAELARESANRALELDPENAIAYDALATIYIRELKIDQAQEAFEQAYTMNPNDSDILDDYVRFVVDYRNDRELALRLISELLTIDPGRQGAAGVVNMRFGDLQAARDAFLLNAEASPNIGSGRLNVALIEQLLGNPGASTTHLNIAAEIPVDAQPGNFQSIPSYAQAAQYFRRLGRVDKAQQYYQLYLEGVARAPVQMREPALDVRALLGAGDNAAALEKLRLVADQRLAGIGDTYTQPSLLLNLWRDPILETPEFLEQRRRMGYRGESNQRLQ